MKLKDELYYKIMEEDLSKKSTFKYLHSKWFYCFHHILKSYKVGYTNKTIRSLFYDFEMCNWTALHKDKIPEFANKNKDELYESFVAECQYIDDRASYDRLFRAHWIFRQMFDKELFDYNWKMRKEK